MSAEKKVKIEPVKPQTAAAKSTPNVETSTAPKKADALTTSKNGDAEVTSTSRAKNTPVNETPVSQTASPNDESSRGAVQPDQRSLRDVDDTSNIYDSSGADYSSSAPSSYVAEPVDQKELMKLVEEEQNLEANKKASKIASQAIATYFGGAAGGAAASAINKSGIADPIHESIAEDVDELNKVLPGGHRVQDSLRNLDKKGGMDALQTALDIVGTKGKGGGSQAAQAAGGQAAQQAGKQAAEQVGNQAAKKVGEEAGKQGLSQQAKQEFQDRAQQAVQNQQAKKQAEDAQKTLQERKKEREKRKEKKKVVRFFMTHPWVLWILLGFFLLFIIMLVLLFILTGALTEEQEESYIDPTYDFSQTMVTLTNSYTNETDKVTFDRLILADFLAGMAYAQLYDDVKDLNDAQKLEAYKAFMVSAKALIFNIGGYDYTTKEITIQSGSGGAPYCDVDNGCIILKYNGATTYVSNAYSHLVQGEEIASRDELLLSEQTIIFKAYNDTKYEVVTPKSLNTLLEKYNYGNVKYNKNVEDYWVEQASKNKNYEKIVTSTDGYENLKVYNLEDYAMKYNYASSSTYWWPIGSTSETNGIYGGTPSTTYVSSKFGPRTVQGVSGYHKGIDIAGTLNQHVIIATKSGTVTTVSDGCASVGSYGNRCGGGYGNYVIIDHGDGTASVYAHMYKDSITVQTGTTVKQGQKLGMMGSSGSSTGSHLHFEIRVNGQQVDPLQYISAENPRPSSNVEIGYKEGSSNKQSVCLSLKQSGFSNNAVAALMVNMEAESSFRTTALGDGGTSYGLCQWHNGRYTKLKNFCGSEYSTVKCQLSYLIYELQHSYKGVYNYLLSNNSAWSMAEYFCLHFEVPANRYTNCPNRANRSAAKYEAYVNNGCQ